MASACRALRVTGPNHTFVFIFQVGAHSLLLFFLIPSYLLFAVSVSFLRDFILSCGIHQQWHEVLLPRFGLSRASGRFVFYATSTPQRPPGGAGYVSIVCTLYSFHRQPVCIPPMWRYPSAEVSWCVFFSGSRFGPCLGSRCIEGPLSHR